MKTITSSLLSSYPKVTASFTTRHGGVSQPPFSNANLAFHVGDNVVDVQQNHLLLSKTLSYDVEKLVFMSQIHSDNIVIVDETMNFMTPPRCDAIITNCPNIPLMVMSADCTPILLYDPFNEAIGAVHAGREGALNEILPKTLRAMGKTYGTKLNEIHILLGPSIHGCCYEVNEPIAKNVIEKGYTDSLQRIGEKVFLDVNTILVQQLERLGIQKKHIEIIDECTSCFHETYFSYRADAQRTGRIAGVIVLQST